MKKQLIMAALLLVTTAAMAQKSSIGIQVGFMQPTLRESDPTSGSNKLSNINRLNGAKIGLVYDATLIKGFGLSIGLNYAVSGNHTGWENVGNGNFYYPKRKEQNMLHTIEIPIEWQYKFQIAKQTYLILYTGPTVKYNFLSKYKWRIQDIDASGKLQETQQPWADRYKLDNDDVNNDGTNIGDGKHDYTPINITWGLGGGFQYKNYYIRAGYDFGIYLPYKDAYYDKGDEQIRRHGRFDEWSIRLGIYFANF